MKKNITLDKNDEIISDCQPVAKLFNKFFAGIVKELNLAIDIEFLVNVDHIGDPVQKAIEKYKNHPSVKAISEKYENTFSFRYVSLDEIKKEIKNLNTMKACQDTDIQRYQGYKKGASAIKYLNSLKKNSPIVKAVLVKDLVLSTVF